jgi:hypothetical protein
MIRKRNIVPIGIKLTLGRPGFGLWKGAWRDAIIFSALYAPLRRVSSI